MGKSKSRIKKKANAQQWLKRQLSAKAANCVSRDRYKQAPK